MASQPLAFAELLAGGVLIAAAISGESIANVFAGKAKGVKSFKTPKVAAAAAVGTAAAASTPNAAGAPSGIGSFEGKQVCNWIIPILQRARSMGWRGSVNSGYRSAAYQAQVCAHTNGPCAAPGRSRHQGTAYPSCAVDVSDAAGLSSAVGRMGAFARGLQWAGSKDPVHFSVPSGGGY